MTYRFSLAVAAASAALALAAAPSTTLAAELLTNGSFEQIGGATPEGWGGLTYYAGGIPTIPGWTVESGSVDLTTTGSFWGPAYDGIYSLDINGWDPGRITQSFNTVIGKLYNVSFAYSRNIAGAADPATATVSAGGQTFNVVAPADGPFTNAGRMAWVTDGFSFVGTGAPTTLALAATNGTNGGVFFDAISVQMAVPEPATWAMMIGGFGLAGAALRRRRALLAA